MSKNNQNRVILVAQHRGKHYVFTGDCFKPGLFKKAQDKNLSHDDAEKACQAMLVREYPTANLKPYSKGGAFVNHPFLFSNKDIWLHVFVVDLPDSFATPVWVEGAILKPMDKFSHQAVVSSLLDQDSNVVSMT